MTMRHLISDQLAAFNAFPEQDVALVSVRRPDSEDLDSACKALLDTRQVIDRNWTQSSRRGESAREALADSSECGDLVAIADEIDAAVLMLEDLLDCPTVDVRLQSLRRPMCPRFHRDHVRCRLLVTLFGPGTEWVANEADAGDSAADTSAGLKQAPVRTFDTGAWSLLKGGVWDEQYEGVLHRSPPVTGERLLLALDPQPAPEDHR